jgi:hypothetical protein
MAALVPELAGIPVRGTFNGELVAFGPDDRMPDFPLICERMLMRRQHISVCFVIFDLLSLEDESSVHLARREYGRSTSFATSQVVTPLRRWSVALATRQ